MHSLPVFVVLLLLLDTIVCSKSICNPVQGHNPHSLLCVCVCVCVGVCVCVCVCVCVMCYASHCVCGGWVFVVVYASDSGGVSARWCVCFVLCLCVCVCVCV